MIRQDLRHNRVSCGLSCPTLQYMMDKQNRLISFFANISNWTYPLTAASTLPHHHFPHGTWAKLFTIVEENDPNANKEPARRPYKLVILDKDAAPVLIIMYADYWGTYLKSDGKILLRLDKLMYVFLKMPRIGGQDPDQSISRSRLQTRAGNNMYWKLSETKAWTVLFNGGQLLHRNEEKWRLEYECIECWRERLTSLL